MQPFNSITGVALPFYRANIDTDVIIPSRAIREVSRAGLGRSLFANLRYLPGDLELKPDFILNQPEYRESCILIAGQNFGCGSSREHAVWALLDYGFRVLIAPSFGAIFHRNCINNGLLPIQLQEADVARLAEQAEADPAQYRLEVVLASQTVVSTSGETFSFSIEADAKQQLLRGLDPIDLTLESIKDDLLAFEKKDRKNRPWLHNHGV